MRALSVSYVLYAQSFCSSANLARNTIPDFLVKEGHLIHYLNLSIPAKFVYLHSRKVVEIFKNMCYYIFVKFSIQKPYTFQRG